MQTDSRKILMVGLDGAPAALLLENAALANLRRLMEAGCHGPLTAARSTDAKRAWPSVLVGEHPTAWSPEPGDEDDLCLSELGHLIATETEKEVQDVERALRKPDLNTLCWIHSGLGRLLRAVREAASLGSSPEGTGPAPCQVVQTHLQRLDEALGGILEFVDERTLVLVVSPRGTPPGPGLPNLEGAFVLAVPDLIGTGRVDGISLEDLAATLHELSGTEPSADLPVDSQVGRIFALPSSDTPDLDADEALIRERLSGLGYLG